MSLIPLFSNAIVGIAITARTITCSWIEPTGDEHVPYDLRAYKMILFDVGPKNSLTIFNPTRLSSLIQIFLEKNSLEDASIVFSLSGQGVFEKQLMLSRPTADLKKLENSENIVWHYYCLQDDETHPTAPWYCCGMPPELLFQYQLFAMRSRMNLIQITTPTMALVQAYKFLRGTKSEQKENNNSDQYSKLTITDYLNLNDYVRVRSHKDHAAVIEGFGLYLLGKQIHEEY